MMICRVCIFQTPQFVLDLPHLHTCTRKKLRLAEGTTNDYYSVPNASKGANDRPTKRQIDRDGETPIT